MSSSSYAVDLLLELHACSAALPLLYRRQNPRLKAGFGPVEMATRRHYKQSFTAALDVEGKNWLDLAAPATNEAT
jgi:hypothetical protein